MKTIFIIILLITLNQSHKVVFDIPAFKNKSLLEIKKVLGKPFYNDVPSNYKTQSGTTGAAWFKNGDFTLEITYNPVNYKVNDFFIEKSKPVENYKMLEEAGNVINSKEYILSPVRYGKNPSLFTGVTVTPK